MRIDKLRAEKRVFTWSQLAELSSASWTHYAALLPLVGYLILFNDQVAAALSFEKLTGGESSLMLSGKARLQLVYFGMLGLSIGLVWLRFRCPFEIRKRPDKEDFVTHALDNFSIQDFVNGYLYLEEKYGFGKFDDVPFSRDDLFGFLNTALPVHVRAEELSDDELALQMYEVENASKAKGKYQEFLIFLARAYYDYMQLSQKSEAYVLGFFLSFSTVLLVIPSLDVFIAVLKDLAL